MIEKETKKGDSSQETENTQPVEEKPPSEKEAENMIRNVKTIEHVKPKQPMNSIQSTEPTEPVKPERSPVLGNYTKNGKTFIVVTDKKYLEEKDAKYLFGINLMSESEYNQKQKWEVDAIRRRNEEFQRKRQELQTRIDQNKMDIMEQNRFNMIVGRPLIPTPWIVPPPSPRDDEESSAEESEESDEENWTMDENGEDNNLDKFKDLDDE